MNCREGLMLRSRGAADNTLDEQSRIRLKTIRCRRGDLGVRDSSPPKDRLAVASLRVKQASFSVAVLLLSTPKAFGIAPPAKTAVLRVRARRGSPLHALMRRVLDTITIVYPLGSWITSTHESGSDIYGKIERFLSSARLIL